MRTWLVAGGALLLAYGVMRLISTMWGDPTLIEVPANNTLISAIVIGVGVVLLVVSYFMKGESTEEA
jgi:hypothetical protein